MAKEKIERVKKENFKYEKIKEKDENGKEKKIFRITPKEGKKNEVVDFNEVMEEIFKQGI